MSKCVYLLYDVNNIVRYVGQGTLKRSKDRNNARSQEYRDILKDGGYIKVIEDGLSKDSAIEIERRLITEYFDGKYPDWDLLNKVKGTVLKYIKYESIKYRLKIDTTSETFLVWDYDCIKTNGRLCSKARVGFKAGAIHNSCYGTVIIDGIAYPIHRIVWSLHNKQDLSTDLVINHIDGNPSNNHPDNLEAVSQKENSHKTTRKTPPKSTGIVGLRLVERKGNKLAMAYYSDKNTRQITKSFSFNKYGEDLAVSLAIAWRRQRMIEEYGTDFTYNHLGENAVAPESSKYTQLDGDGLKILSENYEVNDRFRKLVINRRRIIDERNDLIPLFGTNSVANRLNEWVKDGFIGRVIHGYLIEDYNEELHKDANHSNSISPVESLDVHVRRAFVGNGKTFLSPSDFSIRIKGFNDINTATLIATQTKKGMSVYGVYYKEGTIEDLNREILRRLTEHNKEMYNE